MSDKVSAFPPIATHQQFLDFLTVLREDLHGGGQAWGNGNLADFLEAMQAWIADMNGYYTDTGQPVPKNVSWQVFADILRAARVYE